MAVTFNSGTDTATLSGTEADPDTLDMIVAAVANVAKASKVGGYTYFFSFAILSAASGFLQFDADTVTTFTSTRWDKNGATGGIIFRERSVVRQEGNGYNYTVTSINGLTGYKVIAYRDIEGVNPRFILAASSRYDFLTSHDSPINTPTFVITGLDVETIGNNSGAGVSASLKFYASAASSISNLRIFSRDSLGCEFQARSGIFSFLALEGAGIAMSLAASQTLTLIQPTFNFKGSASPLTFNFNTAPSFVDIQDPLFPNGAWNGNYRGVTDGFRGSANNIVNISYTSKLIFLNGSIPRQLKVRHTRNDATNIDLTADAGGIISQLLLTSTRNGSGFSTGIVAASSTYTWSIKARLYNFVVAADSDVLYSANSFAAAASLFVQVSIVPFLALSESAAAALTGIALTASGTSLGTTAITIGRTVVEVWQYYRQFIANFANFESNDTWNYDGVFLDLATWNITITAALTGKIKCAGTITLGAGGSVTSATTAATTIVIVQPGSITLLWEFAQNTVVNVSSGTAIVTVPADQVSKIIAGTGVTIQVPQASIRFFGIPNVANAIISVQDLTTNAITYPTIVSGEVTIAVNTARNYKVRADAPGYLASRFFTIPGTTPEFQFNLADYRSLYLSGVNRASQISFNPTTFVITISDLTLALSFADVFRTIEDYLASQQGLAYTAHPFPIILPSKNLLWFPFDTVANAVNPARIKPATTNTSDPELLFETYLEGAADTTYGLFDFTGAGGRIIRIRSEVAIAQVQGDGSFTISDRTKLEGLNATLISSGVFSAPSLANVPGGGDFIIL